MLSKPAWTIRFSETFESGCREADDRRRTITSKIISPDMSAA